jgi:hypothetical protein
LVSGSFYRIYLSELRALSGMSTFISVYIVHTDLHVVFGSHS